MCLDGRREREKKKGRTEQARNCDHAEHYRPADRRYPQPTRPVCPARCPALRYNGVTGRAGVAAATGSHTTVVIGSRREPHGCLQQSPAATDLGPDHACDTITACRSRRLARGKTSASGSVRDFTQVSLRTARRASGGHAQRRDRPVGFTHQVANLSEFRRCRSPRLSSNQKHVPKRNARFSITRACRVARHRPSARR